MSADGSRLAIAERGAIDLISHSSLYTERLGERLGGLLRPGDVVALWGELGTGKTVLAKGIARGLGVSGPVTSPTFVLAHEYDGPVPMYHIDFYRLAPEDMRGVGWEEYLDLPGVVVIEWPDRAKATLPGDRVDITLEHVAQTPGSNAFDAERTKKRTAVGKSNALGMGTKRRVLLEPHGRRAEELVAAVTDAFGD